MYLRSGLIDGFDIENEGCLYLLKSNWKEIKRMDVCNFSMK
jgi:hypothetical protein